MILRKLDRFTQTGGSRLKSSTSGEGRMEGSPLDLYLPRRHQHLPSQGLPSSVHHSTLYNACLNVKGDSQNDVTTTELEIGALTTNWQ
jgi:hypothetical protein